MQPPAPICASHKGVVASGKAPLSVSVFLGLNKNKNGFRQKSDIRPIAVGETLHRLTGKYICAILKEKITTFFHPLQLGNACKAGSEKIVSLHRRELVERRLCGF